VAAIALALISFVACCVAAPALLQPKLFVSASFPSIAVRADGLFATVYGGSAAPGSSAEPTGFAETRAQLHAQEYDGSWWWLESNRTPIPTAYWEIAEWGFPFRCFYGGRRTEPGGGTATLRGAIELPPRFHPASFLPYTPDGPGLASNAVVHVLVWLGFLVIPASLRDARRVRRGKCANCCYDLRPCLSAGCPECGWNRPTPPAS
jgi:hypothetical protein